MWIEAEEFVELAEKMPVLDVRSPGEFEQGHIPGAFSFPLFSNEERAEVGTLYKQIGKQEAMLRGMELVQPKIRTMLEEAISMAKDGKIMVHCWRGGKRSESVANMLKIAGLEVKVLNKGYKSFRKWVLEQFEKEYDLRILGGKTGSGKTIVLHALEKSGENILDLEMLADHRGSSFGKIGLKKKVTPSQFENDMAVALNKMKTGRIWVENESRTIGKLSVPVEFWKQMTKAPIYYIEIPMGERKKILLSEYGEQPLVELKAAVTRLSRKLGGQRTNEIIEHIHAGKADVVMEMLLEYYDKLYIHSLSQKENQTIVHIEFEAFKVKNIVQKLIETSEK